jgi:hypothetical protein
MLKMKPWVVLAGMIMFPLQGMAADFDGFKPLACAIIEAFECAPGESCKKARAQDLNLPQFLKVDFQEKMITGTRPNDGGKLEAAILARANQNGSIILQGAQNGRGWTLTLAKKTGRMSVTAAGDDEGFVLFGACTPLSR